MKLSELVKIRRSLNGIFPSEYEQPLNSSLSSLVEEISEADKSAKIFVQDVKLSREKINDEFGNIRNHLNDYRAYIQSCITVAEKEYYTISNQIYQDGLQDDAKYILTRRKQSLTFADDNARDLFVSRIGMYNSWKYPAIEIRPAFGEITDFLKGCDPLYLLDTSEDLFSETKKKWNDIYQRRLRYYTFNESAEESLHHLPDNQFGLIVGVDYFNFKPLSVIEKLLKEFYTKLRPGGMVVFTYNNCDLPYAVRNVENRFCCYTPGTQVKQISEDIGYEIVKSFDQLENVSWLELRKPGEITTLRGGQTLGEICSFD